MVKQASAAVELVPIETMELVGGELCLDFVNTASRRTPTPRRDRLGTYADLLYWSREAGALSGAQARLLAKEAGRDPARAQDVLQRARELREAIYRVFSAHGGRRKPRSEDLDMICGWWAEAAAHRRLVSRDGGPAFEWPRDAEHLEQPLWPVAVSATELYTSSPDLSRVKECQSDNCNWLFLDVSKNRSRRWCDMRDCGNRAKARRHYERHRAL